MYCQSINTHHKKVKDMIAEFNKSILTAAQQTVSTGARKIIEYTGQQKYNKQKKSSFKQERKQKWTS